MKKMKSFENITKSITFVSSIDTWIIPFCLLSAIVEGISPYINTIMIAYILERIVSGASPLELILLAVLTAVLNAFFYLSIAGLNYLKEWRMHFFSNHYKMRKTNKYFTVDYSQLETSDFENLRQGIQYSDDNMGTIYSVIGQLHKLFSTLISVLAALLILIRLFTKIIRVEQKFLIYSVISIIFITFIAFLLTYIITKMQKRTENLLPPLYEKLTNKNRLAMYLANNVVYHYNIGKDIRIYNVSELITDEMESATKAFIPYFKKIFHISNIPGAMGTASSAIIGGLIYIFVGLYALTGFFGIGDVVLYAGTIQQFIGSVTAMVFAIGELSVIHARLTPTFSLLNMPDQNTNMKNDLDADVQFQSDKEEYEILFDHVSFRYPGSEQYALKNVSFQIKPKERIAIVGTNGAGKTTVIKLLCRLYEPCKGKILINNIDISTIPMEKYRKLLSVVFQDFKLFSFSIGQNLSVSEEFDENLAKKALEDVGFGERLSTLVNGSNSCIYRDFDKNGIEISGGEAQKIAIARSLYANSPIVVLDEPTSALDAIAEAEIYERFDQIVTEKTAIYISHRLSACRFSNRIFVFDQGELKQQGKHEELVLIDGGLYQTLWESQAKYYQ